MNFSYCKLLFTWKHLDFYVYLNGLDDSPNDYHWYMKYDRIFHKVTHVNYDECNAFFAGHYDEIIFNKSASHKPM